MWRESVAQEVMQANVQLAIAVRAVWHEHGHGEAMSADDHAVAHGEWVKRLHTDMDMQEVS